jgi:pimeloyl-ACP methyl ester carboxylesterase
VNTFDAAYDAALAAWPVPYRTHDVPSRFGTTRVYEAGPSDGRPIVLLHGGGMTAPSWYATVGPLTSAGSRVYAVDVICLRGRGVPSAEPVRTRADLVTWLTAVIHGLGLSKADLAGHSYGGWIAAHHAVHAPDTVDRFLSLDASLVFAGYRPEYLLRSVPIFLLGARWVRPLLHWETGGRATGLWADLMCSSADTKAPKLVFPKQLSDEDVARLPARTLVVVAGKAKQHDPRKIEQTARRLLPQAVVEVLPEATHHTVPAEDAVAVNEAVLRFLRD